MAVTLAQLRNQARQMADMPLTTSPFVTEAELTTYINQGGASLHDLITAANEDYYITSVEFTLAATNTYALPLNFYKLRGLDYKSGDLWVNVPAFNFAHRNRYNDTVRRRPDYPERAYRVMQGALFVVPETDFAGTYRLWYLLKYSELVSDSDQLDDLWKEYVVCYAAIQMLQKEESDCSALLRKLDGLERRVVGMTAKRDLGGPRRVAEVRSTYEDDYPR